MTRSYNKFERLIRQFFESKPELEIMVKYLFYEITKIYKTDPSYWNRYNSICRIVRKLEKELFLESMFFNFPRLDLFFNTIDRYGPTRMKIVRKRIKSGYYREWEFEKDY